MYEDLERYGNLPDQSDDEVVLDAMKEIALRKAKWEAEDKKIQESLDEMIGKRRFQ